MREFFKKYRLHLIFITIVLLLLIVFAVASFFVNKDNTANIPIYNNLGKDTFSLNGKIVSVNADTKQIIVNVTNGQNGARDWAGGLQTIYYDEKTNITDESQNKITADKITAEKYIDASGTIGTEKDLLYSITIKNDQNVQKIRGVTQ